MENQQEYLEELKLKKKKYYEIGDFLYANLNKLEKLLSVISEARKKGIRINVVQLSFNGKMIYYNGILPLADF